MAKYHRLTLGERYQIQALVHRGIGVREIGWQLKRHGSTISRELQKRGAPHRPYYALKSHRLTERRKRMPHPQLQVVRGHLERCVRAKIIQDWSPEQIAGRLYLDHEVKIVSHQTIYRFIERDKRDGGKLWKHLRILRKQQKDRKKPHWQPRRWMPDRVMIDDRPKVVEERKRLGDFERDTVFGTHNGSLLLTIVDRTSRLLKLGWLPKKSSDMIHQATVDLLKKEIVRTITNDNGGEFAKHQETGTSLSAQVYFSKPYHSWERGTNENTNGLLRQYFPRKKNIRKRFPQEIKCIENFLNRRPRKCLGYQTPLEVHQRLKRQALR